MTQDFGSLGRSRRRATIWALSGAIVVGLAFAQGGAVAQEGSAAHALADKFSSTEGNAGSQASPTSGAATGGINPDILRKIKAIKKKADAARAAANQGSRSKPSTLSGSEEATKAAREASDKKRREAEALAKAETEAAENRALARTARAAEAARMERVRKASEQKKVREAEAKAARDKAEQEVAKRERARLQRIASEKRKLEAKRTLEAKRVADAARALEAQRKEEERRLAEAERQRMEKRRREQATARQAASTKADETRRADEARREKLRRELESQRKRADEREQANAARNRAQDAEKRRQLEEARQRDWQQAASRDRESMAAQRRAEAEQLSTRLARARDTRSGLGGRSISPPDSIVENDRRVTVLLMMNVGKKGVRRWNKTADPMLCLRDKCYLSQGTQKPAREMLRGKAFGPGVALGTRGLACKGQTSCIFREVNMGGRSVSLQPVDLRILRHDRRTSRLIEADSSCTLINGKLNCDRLYGASGDWHAWVVPENVAEWAGPAVLEAALKAGLR